MSKSLEVELLDSNESIKNRQLWQIIRAPNLQNYYHLESKKYPGYRICINPYTNKVKMDGPEKADNEWQVIRIAADQNSDGWINMMSKIQGYKIVVEDGDLLADKSAVSEKSDKQWRFDIVV